MTSSPFKRAAGGVTSGGMSASHFDNPDFARCYVAGPGHFVPGYEPMQRMAAQLLAERAGETARILVLGAGGGLETAAFARMHPGWSFVAVDPAEAMIEQGKRTLEAAGGADRVEWVQGYVDDAPAGPFDGASCLLTLHFASDDGEKLRTLRGIRTRLQPQRRLALVDLCIDMRGPDRELALERYVQFALGSGADHDDVMRTRERLISVLQLVSPERNEGLLVEAGFQKPELFYAGHAWRGWIAEAGVGR